jgi:hypothetical protein
MKAWREDDYPVILTQRERERRQRMNQRIMTVVTFAVGVAFGVALMVMTHAA